MSEAIQWFLPRASNDAMLEREEAEKAATPRRVSGPDIGVWRRVI